MNKSYNIRKANLKDISSIAKLWKEFMHYHHFTAESNILVFDAETIYKKELVDVLADNTKAIFVLEFNKIIIGYIFCEIRNLQNYFIENRFGFISQIFIEKEFRRIGLGDSLLKKAEEWFIKKNIKKIECLVDVNNVISEYFWTKQFYNTVISIKSKNLEF